jgi:hypothetical protein
MPQTVEQRIDEVFLLEQLVPVGEIERRRNDGRDAVVALVDGHHPADHPHGDALPVLHMIGSRPTMMATTVIIFDRTLPDQHNCPSHSTHHAHHAVHHWRPPCLLGCSDGATCGNRSTTLFTTA